MSRNEAIQESLNEVAAELDEQRADAERRHEELMQELRGIRLAVGHWVDDYNQTTTHVQEQFRREDEERRKLASRIAALELVTSRG